MDSERAVIFVVDSRKGGPTGCVQRAELSLARFRKWKQKRVVRMQ